MKCRLCEATGFRSQAEIWQHVKEVHIRAITDYL